MSGVAALALSATAAWADGAMLALPEQTLAQSLKQVARATGTNILFTPDAVAGVTARPLSGQMTARDAVNALLVDTNLQVISDDSGGLIVTRKSSGTRGQAALQATPIRDAQNEAPAPSGDQPEKKVDDTPQREKVTVTGSRIRGARSASPIVTITQDDMRRSGQNNLGEVVRALPQNFAGGQNPGVMPGSNSNNPNNVNLSGGSGLNLRGLGPDATLTLLNGTRLPYDGLFQATDLSAIPVAAIDRIEILLDGASAIYGSDAVGGVANIILKRDYDGAELSARFGAATDGGYGQRQFTGLAGSAWASGGFLVAGEYSRNDAIRAGHRDYLRYMTNQNVMIYPESEQKGALFSGHQDIGGFSELSLTAWYNDRVSLQTNQSSVSQLLRNARDAETWGVAPAFLVDLSNDWSLKVHGSAGRDEVETRQRIFNPTTGVQTSQNGFRYLNDASAIGTEAEGPLFDLPGGEVRLSIGGGYRKNEFEWIDLISSAIQAGGSDSSYFGFSEINLPLVSSDQNIPLITRLSVNAAVRYEDYDSFGETTTPKIGAVWGLFPGLDLRGSWGKSFKVPTLREQFAGRRLDLFPGTFFGRPAGTQVFYLSGGNPDLTPEQSEMVTAGFVARPEFLDGLRVEVNWFELDYTDRIVNPISPITQALTNALFLDFVTLSPTVAQQNAAFAATGLAVGTFTSNAGNPDFTPAPYVPANIVAIVHNNYTNADSQKVHGVDVSAHYNMDLFGGNLTASANASWLESTRKVTTRTSEQPVSGVIYFPPEFRARFGGSWFKDGFTVSSYLNHIDGVANTNITPNPEGDSMTTVDLIVDYQWTSEVVGDVGFNIAVINVFNEPPPFLQPINALSINYDSTNYPATGRTVSATLTKRF